MISCAIYLEVSGVLKKPRDVLRLSESVDSVCVNSIVFGVQIVELLEGFT